MTSITGEYLNCPNANFQNIYVSNDAIVQNDLTVSGTVTATEFNGPLTATTVLLNDGSAGAPTLTFLNDEKTGIYRDTTSSNGIAVTTNGTKRLKVDNSVCTVSLPLNVGTNAITAGSIHVGDGSNTAPSLSFSTSPDVGFYLNGGESLSLAINSTQQYTFNDGGINMGSNQINCGPLNASNGTFTGPVYTGTNSITGGTISGTLIEAGVGSVTTPSFCFTNEPTLGFYRPTSQTLSFVNSTNSPLSMNNNGVTVTVPLSTQGIIASQAISCPSLSATGLITQQRYALIGSNNAIQAIPANTATYVTWQLVSRNSGFTISLPQNAFTVPVSGLYSVMFKVSWQSGTGCFYDCWIDVNGNATTPPVSSPRYSEYFTGVAAGTSVTSFTLTAVIPLNANDVIHCTVYTNNSGGCNLNGTGTVQNSRFSIVYLSE